MRKNKNLLVIALIAVVNALGYGIIIPILYSYSHQFGLSDFQNGLLFATFSACQFLATPIIGHLSDLYGRKPLLILSLLGTVASFLLMAFAPSAIFLFIARALDGLTSGNLPVAQAVISDTTEPKDRAKGFGIIGAAFGFGFTFGPAISALTLRFGTSVPFLIAAGVTTIAVLLTAIVLPETNTHKGQVAHRKLFDVKKLVRAIGDENVGKTLMISLFYSFAFGLFIYAFQPMSIEVLHLTATEISVIFTLFGLIGAIAQIGIVGRVTKSLGEMKALTTALMGLTAAFLALFFVKTFVLFVFVSIIVALVNAFINPLIQVLLSREVDAKSQGEIMGVNTSYVSLGMIFGPIVGGALATLSIPLPFAAGSAVLSMCVFFALHILRRHRQVALG